MDSQLQPKNIKRCWMVKKLFKKNGETTELSFSNGNVTVDGKPLNLGDHFFVVM